MKMPADRSTDMKKKELLDFVDKVSSYLHAKKKKEILASRLAKNSREAEYIRSRIAMVRKRLDGKKDAAGEMEPRVKEPREKLISLRSERQATENKYATLKEIQRDVEKKRVLLQDKRMRFKDLAQDVQRASEKLKTLQSRHEEGLARRSQAEQTIELRKTQLNRMEEEISLMTNTKQILEGLIPEDIGAEDFTSLESENIEKTIEKYIAEVNETIEKMGNEISTLKEQIDESHAEEKTLSSEKERLQRKVDELSSRISTDEDKESLMTEVNGLEKRHESIVRDIDMNREEVKGIESAIKKAESDIVHQREFQENYLERLTYLTAIKQQMESIDNIEAEMERLRNETQRLNVDADANTNFLYIVNRAREQVESVNGSLRSTVDGYSEAFNRIERVVNEEVDL